MRVVSFYDVQPIPRYDGIRWTQVKIGEAAGQEGPFTVIDTINLSPVDVDPAHPDLRYITTEKATLDTGWYQITFLDATGDVQQPVAPLWSGPDETSGYLPQISDIGAVMTARTKDAHGNYLGTFTTDTRPTDDEVRRLIDISADEVTMSIDTDIPVGAYQFVRAAIIWKTAMAIELSFFPEQVGSTGSPYDRMLSMYNSSMDKLGTAVNREWMESITGDETYGGANVMFGGFPPSDNLMSRPL